MIKLNADMLLLTQTQYDKINETLKHLVSFNNNKTKLYLFRKLQKELGFDAGIEDRGNKTFFIEKPIFKWELEEELWELIHGNGLEVKRLISFLRSVLPHLNINGGVTIKPNAKIVMVMILDAILKTQRSYTEEELNNFGYSMLFLWSVKGYDKEFLKKLLDVVEHWVNGTYKYGEHPDLFTLMGMIDKRGDLINNPVDVNLNDFVQVGIDNNQCTGTMTGLNVIDLLLFRLIYKGNIEINEILRYLKFTYGTTFHDYEIKWSFLMQMNSLLDMDNMNLEFIDIVAESYRYSQPNVLDRYEPCIDNVK